MNENPQDNGEPKGGSRRSRTASSVVDDVVQEVTKGRKAPGIIIAIIMIVLGILLLVRPLFTEVVFMYIAVVGFVIYGVFQIITYATTPAPSRTGWTLASGILFVVVGILIMFSGVPNMIYTFAFLLGFLAMFSGVNRISQSMTLKREGQKGWGWVLTSGILNLVLSIFFIIAPFMLAWVLAYVLGIYLIVGGVALFVEACSGHLGHRL